MTRSPEKASNAKKPQINTYYRTVAKRFAAAKFITLILLIVFLLMTLALGRNEITLENLQYLMKFISFTNTETSITAPRINYSSGDNIRLSLFIGDLCYLSPDTYTVYDSRGNTIMTSSHKYNYPILKTSEKFTLCYDLEGYSFAIYNTFSRLYEDTLDYPITDGDIADSGEFAISTSTREYRTAVLVYDSDLKQVSRVLRENHLTDVKLKPDGSELAVMTLSSVDGAYRTTIELISRGHDYVRKWITLDGIGYSLEYTDRGFSLVCDDRIMFFDSDLATIENRPLSSSLVMTDASDKYLTAVCSTGIIGNNYEATVYDSKGTVMYSGRFDGKLASVTHDETGEYIFILAADEVIRINLVNRMVGSTSVAQGGTQIIAQSPDSFLLAMSSYALTYTPENFDEQYYDRNTEVSQ